MATSSVGGIVTSLTRARTLARTPACTNRWTHAYARTLGEETGVLHTNPAIEYKQQVPEMKLMHRFVHTVHKLSILALDY